MARVPGGGGGGSFEGQQCDLKTPQKGSENLLEMPFTCKKWVEHAF